MGTNYYYRSNLCDCCNRYDEKHIGRSSCGWQFFFRAHGGISSYAEWKREFACAGMIFDEYGSEMSRENFITMIETKQAGLNHYEECGRDGYCMDGEWKDEEGYSFSEREFS